MQYVEFSGRRAEEWSGYLESRMLESERCLNTFVILMRIRQMREQERCARSDWVRAGTGEVPVMQLVGGRAGAG